MLAQYINLINAENMDYLKNLGDVEIIPSEDVISVFRNLYPLTDNTEYPWLELRVPWVFDFNYKFDSNLHLGATKATGMGE